MKQDDTAHDAKLHETARRLGIAAAERLDVERVAIRVVERLRAEPDGRPGWRVPAWWRIAAAVVILVGAAVVLRMTIPGAEGIAHTPAHLVADDLQDLSTAELEAVLATLDETLDLSGEAIPDTTLDDLDAQQLDAVLRSMEG